MFTFLKSRGFLLLIGFVLIGLFIWFAGPYFSFGFGRLSSQPLGSTWARLVCIGLVLVVALAWRGIAWWRARKASAALAGAVLQPRGDDRPSDEVSRLRERFEEAVAALNASASRGQSLYDLPWYAFIGAPGSGKTTALAHSGLKFPLEQRAGRTPVRGIGGTRNCDWWFTEQAVFLDTAGRYTSQDSDATSDSEGWREFLALLGTYRKRRPLNGIVVTMSAHDLLAPGGAGLETHVENVQRRLTEFVRELQVQLPVYVMVTKCDMVAGFADFFDDLSTDDRRQVWGVTFPYEESRAGGASRRFAGEFDALLARLNSRVLSRVESGRGSRRRAAVFAFPQQMAALRDPLVQWLSDVFTARSLEGRVLLRGVYFTSGTQDGTQIDRLMGTIGRRFGVTAEATQIGTGREKAYFVERLLADVVIAESGLAGVNWKLERRKALLQFGAYAAIAMVVILGVLALSVSYARNRTYIGQVAADVASLQRLPTPVTGSRVESLLPRLNAVAAVVDSAERYRESGVPLMMRWGLYQGSSLGNAAQDAYARELDGLLLPQFAERVQRHVREYAADPDRLYVYLKGYLMLGQPQHVQKDHLQMLADIEWPPPQGSTAPSVSTHLGRFLDSRNGVRPIALDGPLVAQAQSTINRASIAQIMYGWLQRDELKDTARALRFDVEAGVGIEKVLQRRSRRPIAEPFPRLYTRDAFKEVTTTGMAIYVKQFAEESWVWGTTRGLSLDQVGTLRGQVTELYERDYIRAWNEWLQDLEVKPFASLTDYREALGIMVGPASPLRGLLTTVVKQTSLVEAPTAAPAGTPSVTSRITQGARDLFKTTTEKITGSSGVTPGTQVTTAFQPIHKVMAGAPAPFDGVVEQVRKIRDQLQKVGDQIGGNDPLKAVSDPALLELWRGLRQDAGTLPSPLDTWFSQIAQYTGNRVAEAATESLEKLYANQVVPECRVRVAGRYPFGPASAGDLSLTDFAEAFGPGGLYDKFFNERLQMLVDTTQRPWTWRPDAVHPGAAVLAQFERVDGIRRMFFGASRTPKVAFTAVATDLDAGATGFFFSLDGQILRATPGQPRRLAMEWPGPPPGPAGLRAAFEDRQAPAADAHNLGGPWALFRLVDAVESTIESDRDTLLAIRSPYHNVRLRLTAANPAANPFGTREWRQFSCES